MKKYLAILLLLCLLLPAQAEIVGKTSNGEHIHAYTADNGQTIYFTALEPDPFITRQDVNFDGQEDLLVCVSAGASNGYFEFFVREDERYVQSSHDGLGYGICNYQLFPDKGLVLSQANNGFAGMLHEWCLFRWEGTELKMIRRAVSDLDSEYIWYDDGYALRSYDNRLRVEVRCWNAATDEWETALEECVSLQDESWMSREEAAFWQGI